MKISIKNIFLAICIIIICSCKNLDDRGYTGDRIITYVIDKKYLLIKNKLDIDSLSKLDNESKDNIVSIQIMTDSNIIINDAINNCKNAIELKIISSGRIVFDLSANNKSIKRLDIYSKVATIQNIYQLENIEYIFYYWYDTVNNHHNNIIAEFSKLNKLRYLQLDLNQNSKFDKSIGQLNNLEVLYLNFCSLEVIPKYISNLPNLKTLIIKSDYNFKIPKSIYKMKSLEKIIVIGSPFNTSQIRKNLLKYPKIKLEYYTSFTQPLEYMIKKQ